METKGKKYAILSDCHLGDGKFTDDFRPNENCLLKALNYYYDNDYVLILLGDIEELWQFSLDEIIKRYGNSVYLILHEFADKNRIYRVLGNHDLDWRDLRTPAFVVNSLCKATEAIKLEDENGKVDIILVHGHQGTFDSDVYSNFFRFWVHLYRVVEPVAHFVGLDMDTSITHSEVTNEYERSYYEWAKENKVMVICGHSHRAIFASRSYIRKLKEQVDALQNEIDTNKYDTELVKENNREIARLHKEIKHEISRNREVEISDQSKLVPCYFNSGCGVYKDGITTIEIADGIISLNKWSNKSHSKHEIQYEHHSLGDFVNQIQAA